MGDQAQTIYFDDYGTKQTIVTSMEIMGQKSETIAITADGYRHFMQANGLGERVAAILHGLNVQDLTELARRALARP